MEEKLKAVLYNHHILLRLLGRRKIPVYTDALLLFFFCGKVCGIMSYTRGRQDNQFLPPTGLTKLKQDDHNNLPSVLTKSGLYFLGRGSLAPALLSQLFNAQLIQQVGTQDALRSGTNLLFWLLSPINCPTHR